MRVIVTACGGKMGKTNVRVVSEDKDSRLAGATEIAGSPLIGRDAGEIAGIDSLGVPVTGSLDELPEADVLIDFSSPRALDAHLRFALERRIALVVGSTGLSDDEKARIREAGKSIPAIWAPNYSVGIFLINKLARIAAEVLGDGFDAEIVEMHHRMKKDAPSGTAIQLLNTLKKVYGTEDVVYGRNGITGERPARQIGVHAVRGGDVVGDHTVIFAGNGERVEIVHKASTRETFARGALKAAKFIVAKGTGFWTMDDVISIGGGL